MQHFVARQPYCVEDSPLLQVLIDVRLGECGIGRIARAIADMALARSEGSPRRFYSMSSQIRRERADYYTILERTQKGTPDVSEWMGWFVSCLGRAIEGSETTLMAVLEKASLWEEIASLPINERQRVVINNLLDRLERTLTTL